MWLRFLLAATIQFIAPELASAQQISSSDFRTQLRFVRFVANTATDASLMVGMATLPTPVGWVALAAGGIGKAFLMKSDIDDKRAAGATTPQALRDVITPEAVAAYAIPEFRATKNVAIIAVRSSGNTVVGNEIERVYDEVQSAFIPYGEDPNKRRWRALETTGIGRAGSATAQAGKCETALPVGSEVYSLVRELIPDGCRTDGMPEDRSATFAQVAAMCSGGAYSLVMDVQIQRVNDTQIGVKRRIRIGGQWADTFVSYELCEPAQTGSNNSLR